VQCSAVQCFTLRCIVQNSAIWHGTGQDIMVQNNVLQYDVALHLHRNCSPNNPRDMPYRDSTILCPPLFSFHTCNGDSITVTTATHSSLNTRCYNTRRLFSSPQNGSFSLHHSQIGTSRHGRGPWTRPLLSDSTTLPWMLELLRSTSTCSWCH
jgi:hypothetical protein